jgi:hypothetical protein
MDKDADIQYVLGNIGLCDLFFLFAYCPYYAYSQYMSILNQSRSPHMLHSTVTAQCTGADDAHHVKGYIADKDAP